MKAQGNGPVDVSWPTRTLASVVECVFVGLPTARYVARGVEESISVPVLSVGDIHDDQVNDLRNVTMVGLRPGAIDRFRVRGGDVLVACRGTQLKAALVSPEIAGAFASSNIIVVRPGEAIAPELVAALLRSPVWQDVLRSRARSSAGLMQLTLKDLEDLPVPMLPLELQAELVLLIQAEREHYWSALAAANLRRARVETLVSRVLLGKKPAQGPKS